MRITVRPCQIAGLPVSVGAGLAPPGGTMSVFAFARARRKNAGSPRGRGKPLPYGRREHFKTPLA